MEHDAVSLFQQAELYYQSGNFNEALKKYKQVVQEFPNHSLATKSLTNIGQILIQQERWEEAKPYLDQSLARERTVAALINLAHWYLKGVRNIQKAEETIDVALAMEPEQVEALTIRGMVYKMSGRRRQALKIFQKLAKIEPSREFFQEQLRELFRGKP